MSKLNDNFRGLREITDTFERSVAAALRAAMAGGQTVVFNYDGKERVVEVHAIGITKDGNVVFRGYQIAGESSDGRLPAWRLFTLNKIEQGLHITFNQSQAPRSGYVTGDRSMATVLSEIDVA